MSLNSPTYQHNTNHITLHQSSSAPQSSPQQQQKEKSHQRLQITVPDESSSSAGNRDDTAATTPHKCIKGLLQQSIPSPQSLLIKSPDENHHIGNAPKNTMHGRKRRRPQDFNGNAIKTDASSATKRQQHHWVQNLSQEEQNSNNNGSAPTWTDTTSIQFSILKQRIFTLWSQLDIPSREQHYITFNYFKPRDISYFYLLKKYVSYLLLYKEKMECIQSAIDTREAFLKKLHRLRDKWQRKEFGNYKLLQKELRILVKRLRWRTVDIIESIQEWRDMQNVKQVWWHNGGRYHTDRENILFKVQHDLQFIRKSTLSALIEQHEIEQRDHLVLKHIDQKLKHLRKEQRQLRKHLKISPSNGRSGSSPLARNQIEAQNIASNGSNHRTTQYKHSNSPTTNNRYRSSVASINSSRDFHAQSTTAVQTPDSPRHDGAPSSMMRHSLIDRPSTAHTQRTSSHHSPFTPPRSFANQFPTDQTRPVSAQLRGLSTKRKNSLLKQSTLIKKPLTPAQSPHSHHVRNVFQLRDENPDRRIISPASSPKTPNSQSPSSPRFLSKQMSDPFIAIHPDFDQSDDSLHVELRKLTQQEETLLRLQRAYTILSEEKDVHKHWLHVEPSFFPVQKSSTTRSMENSNNSNDPRHLMLTLRFDEMESYSEVRDEEFEQQWILYNESATKIQALFHGYQERKRFSVLVAKKRLEEPAALTIQKIWHQYIARNVLQRLRQQEAQRMHNQLEREYAALEIQRLFRGHMGRKHHDRLDRLDRKGESISIIQRNARKYLAMKRVQHLQHIYLEECDNLIRQEHAAVAVQKLYRGYSTRKQWPQLRIHLHREKQAICIQCMYRCFAARKITSILKYNAEVDLYRYLDREEATLTIQTWFRCHRQRNAYIRMVEAKKLHDACTLIQRLYREERWRRFRRAASETIQRAWRVYLSRMARKSLEKLYEQDLQRESLAEKSALTIQTLWCRYRDLQIYYRQKEMHHAAITLQCFWRRSMAMRVRQTFLQNQKAVIIWCQSIVRMLPVRNSYEFQVSFQVLDYADLLMGTSLKDDASTIIQCTWRRFKAKKMLRQLKDEKLICLVQNGIRAIQAHNDLLFRIEFSHDEKQVVFVQSRGQRICFRSDLDRVILVQSSFRHRLREHQQAIRIQCLMRRFLARRRVMRLRAAVEHAIRSEIRAEQMERRKKLAHTLKVRRLLQKNNKMASEVMQARLKGTGATVLQGVSLREMKRMA